MIQVNRREKESRENRLSVHHQLRVQQNPQSVDGFFSLREEKETEKEEGREEGKFCRRKIVRSPPRPSSAPWNSLQKSNLRIGLALVENGCHSSQRCLYTPVLISPEAPCLPVWFTGRWSRQLGSAYYLINDPLGYSDHFRFGDNPPGGKGRGQNRAGVVMDFPRRTVLRSATLITRINCIVIKGPPGGDSRRLSWDRTSPLLRTRTLLVSSTRRRSLTSTMANPRIDPTIDNGISLSRGKRDIVVGGEGCLREFFFFFSRNALRSSGL